MNAIRILHVDDEPDIREIVDMALGLNADFEVRSSASGVEALGTAAVWLPLLILLDVMMPGMDGPTTLGQLRKTPSTADIPVLFMTARAQTREIEHFISLGAQGVISKPFDPMTLAFLVRSHLQAARLGTMRGAFLRRAKTDADALNALRSSIGGKADPAAMNRIRDIAHALAGAAGLFGLDRIGDDAAALEDAVREALCGRLTRREVTQALDRLLAGLECDWVAPFVAAVA
jgi:CheY-like chemotaxis protein